MMPNGPMNGADCGRREFARRNSDSSPRRGPRPIRARVFISYSRKDGAFAERLHGAIIATGFESYLDKDDILPGEPWRKQLEGLILAADAVVIVISPDSVSSEHSGGRLRALWSSTRT
jgi:hypothetical protein